MSDEAQDIKIAAILSCPMVGWNPHYGSVSEALRQFGIPLRIGYGAYWHHTMSNLMEDCVNDELDWILTLDYDTLTDAIDLDRLIGTFGANSHMDALAALQCKRGTDESPLLSVPEVSEIEITGEPIKAFTAHFGMTLFRVEALKRFPMPWFPDKPDPKGSYKTAQRTDADIAFWHGWRDAGNSLYVEPNVIIGHLQPMVAVFDEHMRVKHQHFVDWRKDRADRRAKLVGAQ